MTASSAVPVPYFRALFIKVLETTYKSYQPSASRLVKYVRLSVKGFTISEWVKRESVREKTARNRQWIHIGIRSCCIKAHTHTHTPLLPPAQLQNAAGTPGLLLQPLISIKLQLI